ncbi:hypothetical protein FOA52_014018 [Chlamydomonas sp. UWO 241]|nr:hypothetical protein FOA52_014018 [Chlamydomonas sp. UWO 241]
MLAVPTDATFQGTLYVTTNPEEEAGNNATREGPSLGDGVPGNVYLLKTMATVSDVITLTWEVDIPGFDPIYMVTGMRILVTGPYDAELYTLIVRSLEVLQIGVDKDYMYGDGVLQLTSITFLIDLPDQCGGKLTTSRSTFDRYWTNDCGQANCGSRYSPALITIQDYYDMCSYSQVGFTAANNIVVGPVLMPCSTAGYSFSSCATRDLFGWAAWLEAYATTELKLDLSRFSRRVLMMPRTTCPWAGLANVGCGGTCYAWINSNRATSPETVFHELGHTLGLHHASTGSSEYGDASSAMGVPSTVTCFNAPQSWQLGWVKPIAELDGNSLLEGQQATYFIPAMSSNNVNFIKVTPTWDTKAKPLFISYRDDQGFDTKLSFSYKNALSVHTFGGFTVPVVRWPEPSVLQAVLRNVDAPSPPPPRHPSLPTPPHASPPLPDAPTFMMWVSTPFDGNSNVDVASTTSVLCPAMAATIRGALTAAGLDYNAVMVGRDPDLGDCVKVTGLPTRGPFQRIAYKFYFALYPEQWLGVAAALRSGASMRSGHVMCDSTVYWQKFNTNIGTLPPAGADNEPQWLGAAGQTSGVCYRDALAALRG